MSNELSLREGIKIQKWYLCLKDTNYFVESMLVSLMSKENSTLKKAKTQTIWEGSYKRFEYNNPQKQQ